MTRQNFWAYKTPRIARSVAVDRFPFEWRLRNFGVDASGALGNHSQRFSERFPRMKMRRRPLCSCLRTIRQSGGNGCLVFLLALLSQGGCESGRYSYYVSPQVSGRVLAADTMLPLGQATVRRVTPAPSAGEATLPKGGQLQTQARGVRTDPEGRFVIEGEQVMTIFFHGHWHSVTIDFDCPGYEELETNFTAAVFRKRSAEGVPLVETGDILLQRVAP